MVGKGCIGALVVPLRCFLFLPPNYIHVYAFIVHHYYVDKRGVLQQEYA